jgi:hypothetical protein
MQYDLHTLVAKGGTLIERQWHAHAIRSGVIRILC